MDPAKVTAVSEWPASDQHRGAAVCPAWDCKLLSEVHLQIQLPCCSARSPHLHALPLDTWGCLYGTQLLFCLNPSPSIDWGVGAVLFQRSSHVHSSKLDSLMLSWLWSTDATDCRAVTNLSSYGQIIRISIQSAKRPNPHQPTWASFFGTIDLSWFMIYCPGSLNFKPNALSRTVRCWGVWFYSGSHPPVYLLYRHRHLGDRVTGEASSESTAWPGNTPPNCLFVPYSVRLSTELSQLVSPAILVSTGPFPSSINGSCGLPCMPTLVFHLCLFSVPKTSHQRSPALSLLSASPQRSVVPCCLGFHHRYPSVWRWNGQTHHHS